MREIGYVVRGFLTVRRDSLRVPLSGSLTVDADQDSGLFSGDLALRPSTINRAVLGVSLFSATVQIEAGCPVIGRVDPEGRMFAAVTVDAVIANVHAARRALMRDGACRTATHAVVPLRSRPGFNLERGGRVVGRYHRPPFTGCGWITPVVNLLIAGPGNAVVIDLIPDALSARRLTCAFRAATSPAIRAGWCCGRRRRCRRFEVEGDVTFGAGVVAVGDVRVAGPRHVRDGEVLRR